MLAGAFLCGALFNCPLKRQVPTTLQISDQAGEFVRDKYSNLFGLITSEQEIQALMF